MITVYAAMGFLWAIAALLAAFAAVERGLVSIIQSSSIVAGSHRIKKIILRLDDKTRMKTGDVTTP